MSYATSATDAIDAGPKVECDRPSGSEFPIGTTSVTCTATDAAGHSSTKAFDAIVIAPTPQTQPSTAPAPRRINAVLAFRFTITKKTTRLIQLKVKNIPAGSTVTITCKGNSCPRTLKGSGTSRLGKGSSVSLATLVKGGLRSGTTINVKVSSPGGVTAIKTLMVRSGKAPVVRYKSASSARLSRSGRVTSGTAVAGGVAPARAVVPAVDPDRRQAERLGRHVVVEEALRHVQDALARQADPLEGELEVPARGL